MGSRKYNNTESAMHVQLVQTNVWMAQLQTLMPFSPYFCMCLLVIVGFQKLGWAHFQLLKLLKRGDLVFDGSCVSLSSYYPCLGLAMGLELGTDITQKMNAQRPRPPAFSHSQSRHRWRITTIYRYLHIFFRGFAKKHLFLCVNVISFHRQEPWIHNGIVGTK